MPDPRSRHGRRYPLTTLLGIAGAAALSGAKTSTEVAEFAAELSQEQLAALGCVRRPWQTRYHSPGETALVRLLQRLDVEALDGLVGGWLAEQLPEQDASAVAVDGKTIRGAVGADGRRVHLLAALVHGHGTVVAQRRVEAKTSEIGAFAHMPRPMDPPHPDMKEASGHSHWPTGRQCYEQGRSHGDGDRGDRPDRVVALAAPRVRPASARAR